MPVLTKSTYLGLIMISTDLSPAKHGYLKRLRQELSLIQKSIYQSDANLEAKHTLIKEFVEEFIKTSLDTGTNQQDVTNQMKGVCYDDMLVPGKLHDWCFQRLKTLCQECQQEQSSLSASLRETSVPQKPEPPSPFNKEVVYHAMLLCDAVESCDESNYEQYLSRQATGHYFEQLSVSGTHTEGKLTINRCIIAKKKKMLYVAFHGEPSLREWCQKYPTFREGITQKLGI